MSLKETIKQGILQSGLLRIKQWTLPPTALILYFHSVSPDRDVQKSHIGPGITATTDTFREYMRILRNRFHPVTLDDIAECLEEKKEIPVRSVALTFDDGFYDNYHYAAPIMEEFDIRATFYLTSACVEHQTLPWFCKLLFLFENTKNKGVFHDSFAKRDWNLDSPEEHREAYLYHLYECARFSWKEQNEHILRLEENLNLCYNEGQAPAMMTWEQAKQLIHRGHIIGNHTFSHPNVAYISPEDRQIEIVESHRLLEERLEHPVKHFSYPHPCLNPQHDTASDDLVRSLGYRTIALTEQGWVRSNSSQHALQRVSIAEMPIKAFLWKLETAFAGIKT